MPGLRHVVAPGQIWRRRKIEAMEPPSRRLIYRNEAILHESYSFAAIWNPFKRPFFLLHRALHFNIDRPDHGRTAVFS
jgi:hypothetical protein